MGHPNLGSGACAMAGAPWQSDAATSRQERPILSRIELRASFISLRQRRPPSVASFQSSILGFVVVATTE
jgi:hypothetical protein